MANMMQKGFAHLRDALQENASSKIAILRGNEIVLNANAVVASSAFDDVDATGRRVNVYAVDFLISGILGYVPKAGDIVNLYNELDTVESTYVVKPVAQELWRNDDPYGTIIRVHTQQLG